MSVATNIVQLKIRLLGISPMIWRRVLVPISTSLRELHGIVQVAMGWEGVHLYQFDIRAVHYGSFELFAANPDLPLSDFAFRLNETFRYIYDMGDHWAHEIRVEQFEDQKARKTYPTCTGGSGVCPPEDCGGVEGYLYHRDEAGGYDAWQDMHAMLDLLSNATKPDVGEKAVQEFLTDDVQMTMERVLAREPYMTAKFSRGDVNRTFRAGRHRELMHQQMF